MMPRVLSNHIKKYNGFVFFSVLLYVFCFLDFFFFFCLSVKIKRFKGPESQILMSKTLVSFYLMNSCGSFLKEIPHILHVQPNYDSLLIPKPALALFSISVACTLLLSLPIIGKHNTKYL